MKDTISAVSRSTDDIDPSIRILQKGQLDNGQWALLQEYKNN